MKAIIVIGAAFAAIGIGWAIHPGLGIVVAVLSYGAVEALLAR